MQSQTAMFDDNYGTVSATSPVPQLLIFSICFVLNLSDMKSDGDLFLGHSYAKCSNQLPC